MWALWRSRLVGAFFVAMRVIRQPIYTLRRCRVAFTSRIERGCLLVQTVIGAYSYLGSGVVMNSAIVGNYCSIAAGTKIGGMEHSWWWGSTSPRISRHNVDGRPTIIEDDVWMGSNVIVRQGLCIGRGAVIGAGSVVLGDVAPYTIVAGAPAREIRRRFSAETIARVVETRFWEHSPESARKLLEGISFDRAEDLRPSDKVVSVPREAPGAPSSSDSHYDQGSFHG